MSKNTSRTRKLIALILSLLLIFIFSQEFLYDFRDYDTDRIEKFYKEEKNSIDVMFIGASEVSQGIIPGYAYERYGFTSYMYTLDGNQGAIYLSQLKEIRKYQDPEIIFVDLFGFLNDDDAMLFNKIVLHVYLGGIPFSANKIHTIMHHPYEQKLSLFFPMMMYHGKPTIAYDRLSDVYYLLVKEEKPNPLKGAITRTNTHTGIGDTGKPFDPLTYNLSDGSIACLTEFLDYCKENNLDNIVFTNFPRYIEDESNNSLLFLFAQAEEIVNQYGYPVWNLQSEMDAIGIDVTHDFQDPHHLNIYGQLKITDYIGSKVIHEYGLTPRTQSTENQREWEECAFYTQEYIQMATEKLREKRNWVIYESSYDWLYRE